MINSELLIGSHHGRAQPQNQLHQRYKLRQPPGRFKRRVGEGGGLVGCARLAICRGFAALRRVCLGWVMVRVGGCRTSLVGRFGASLWLGWWGVLGGWAAGTIRLGPVARSWFC